MTRVSPERLSMTDCVEAVTDERVDNDDDEDEDDDEEARICSKNEAGSFPTIAFSFLSFPSVSTSATLIL